MGEVVADYHSAQSYIRRQRPRPRPRSSILDPNTTDQTGTADSVLIGIFHKHKAYIHTTKIIEASSPFSLNNNYYYHWISKFVKNSPPPFHPISISISIPSFQLILLHSFFVLLFADNGQLMKFEMKIFRSDLMFCRDR